MKKLLYITPRIDGAGGLPNVLSIKTNYLTNQWKYQITILTTNAQSTTYFYDFKKINIVNKKIKGKGIVYFYNFLQLVKRQIKLEKPDIIVVVDNGLKGLLLPYFIKTRQNKVVFEQHGYRYYKNIHNASFWTVLSQKAVTFFTNISISKVDHLVVLTPKSLCEWNLKRSCAIPNPLRFSNVEKSTLTNKKIIAVGRQVSEKAFDELLIIWKSIQLIYPDWKLEIYGQIDKNLGLQKLAEELEIDHSVHFFSPVKNIDEKFKQASICLMTSKHEGFGMVLIEAMACGLPCVAFDCPTGPAEIIADGENGFLVPLGQNEAFKNRVIQLIKNKDLRIKLGRKASLSVERFELNRVMQKWHQLYQTLNQNF